MMTDEMVLAIGVIVIGTMALLTAMIETMGWGSTLIIIGLCAASALAFFFVMWLIQLC